MYNQDDRISDKCTLWKVEGLASPIRLFSHEGSLTRNEDMTQESALLTDLKIDDNIATVMYNGSTQQEEKKRMQITFKL